MRTAFKDRRQRTVRLRARPDLPKGVWRLGARRITARLNKSWALNLAGRVGWHGVRTPGDLRMFYLVRHDRQTFVIDFELNRDRADGLASYKFDETFELAWQLLPLSSLEANLPNVNEVYSFDISASCESGCVHVRPTRFSRIAAPLPKKQQGDIGDDAADASDIGEDAEDDVGVGVEEDDVISSECAVDTDVDSAAASSDGNGSEDSDGEDDKLIKPPLPVTVEAQSQSSSSSSEVAKAKATRCFSGRESRRSLWENDYFYIPESSPGNGLRIRMRRPVSKAMGGMGTDLQSRHLTPSHYGETMESCAATMLLLRAWMLWRMRRDGWAFAKECRQRQFDEARQTLQRDIRKIQDQHGGSLGNHNADVMLRKMPILSE